MADPHLPPGRTSSPRAGDGRARHPGDAYIRAQDDWECGRSGVPCRFGPSVSGRCSNRAECSPEKTGDRWVCMRPLARGGPCGKGPLPDGSCCRPPAPCVPRATTKRRLGTAWRLAALIALCAGLVVLYTQAGVSPGPVMSGHAEIEDECGHCHADVARPSLLWAADIARAGLFGEERPLANARTCLACHAFGEAALAAHGTGALPGASATGRRQALRAWSEARRPGPEIRLAAAFVPAALRTSAHGESPSGAPRGRIACIACHREHEGRDFDATAMTDAQCQACHAEPFAGFAGHPPFIGYPHLARSRVSFDHRRHFGRHFGRSARDGIPAPESCGACHDADGRGGMVVRGFAACASCHEAGISDPPGGSAYLELLAPPGLDLEALEDAGIGDWPLLADAEPNAFLTLMLDAGGYLGAGDLGLVGALDLLDLTDAGEEEMRAVVRLAWAFKSLARDLVRDGPSVFVEAARSLHSGPAPGAWADLAASLPFEVASRAARRWFPDLEGELDRHAGEEEAPTRAVEPDFADSEDAQDIDEWLRYGGWRFEEPALVYRPTGHADRFLHGWITFATAPAPGAAALFDALAGDGSPGSCAQCHVTRDRPATAARANGAGAEGDGRLNWFARGSRAVLEWPLESPLESPMKRQPASAREGRAAADGQAVGARPTSLEGAPRPAGRRPLDEPRHLKPFSHHSHRQAIAEDGCVSCHRMAEGGDAGRSPAGFSPLSPEACATCHGERTRLGSCVTCHAYHFENADGDLMRAGGSVEAFDPFGG